MFRFLNIVAVVVLVGSAVYAYEIKYSTIYQAEQLAKAKRDLARETDHVVLLKAEWAHLDDPGRVEALAEKYLGGQTLELTQMVTAAALPEKQPRPDEIAKLSEASAPAPAAAPSVAAAPAKPAVAKPQAAKPRESDHHAKALAKPQTGAKAER
jgi:hypothetical protein